MTDSKIKFTGLYSEDAYNFGRALIENYGNTLMTLVGFTLDQPINLMGETGWRQISTMVKGK